MNRIQISLADGAVIVGYIVFLILVGIFISKKKNQSGKIASEDLFLSGRSLPWYKVGLSIFSTNVSPSMLVASFGAAYTSGMVLANFDWLAWVFLMLLSLLFIPRYLANNISTMPEFLMKRFGNKSHIFFTYFSMISSLIVWSSFMLCIGGIVINQLTGIPIYVSAVLVVAIAMSYSVNGGLNSIVHTGMVQSIVLIGISILIFVLGLNKIGSVEKLISSVPKEFWQVLKPSNDSVYPWHAMLLGYPVIGIWFWCTDQSIVQRILAAKNVDHGQKGTLLIAALKIVMPILFLVPGIMCLVLVKQGVFAPLENPDHAYISMVYGLLPTGIIGLALGTLLVSIINDVATGLSSFSTVFAMDVYLKKINPTANAIQVKAVGKKVIFLAALVSVIVAILLSKSDKGLFDLGQALLTYLAPPASTVFIVGILWKRATPRAAELTLYVGTFLCLLIGFCQLTGFPTKEFWPHFMLLCFYMMATLVIFMVTVSFFTKPHYELVQLVDQNDPIIIEKSRTSLSVKVMWAIIAILMGIVYYFFN
jgi:SSS family solute:Na+ symporter